MNHGAIDGENVPDVQRRIQGHKDRVRAKVKRFRDAQRPFASGKIQHEGVKRIDRRRDDQLPDVQAVRIVQGGGAIDGDRLPPEFVIRM